MLLALWEAVLWAARSLSAKGRRSDRGVLVMLLKFVLQVLFCSSSFRRAPEGCSFYVVMCEGLSTYVSLRFRSICSMWLSSP